MSIALKPAYGAQKFRIQFKIQGSKEIKADFNFVKIEENKDEEFSMNEYLEFFCMVSTLKISPKTHQYSEYDESQHGQS